MNVRNSVLKLVDSQWLHFKECNTFKEAKTLADKLNMEQQSLTVVAAG